MASVSVSAPVPALTSLDRCDLEDQAETNRPLLELHLVMVFITTIEKKVGFPPHSRQTLAS